MMDGPAARSVASLAVVVLDVVVSIILSLGIVALAVFAAPAGPAAADDGCAQPGNSGTPNLWAQQMLAPEQAWPFATGSGQTVAVVDSGVDANQPQLTGRVAAGFDAVAGHGPANTDCAGTGTAVAGAIAAAQTSSTGIYGVAPGVTIVPVRVTGEPGQDPSAPVSPQVLARGIMWAVNDHVDVIDVSVALFVDDAEVKAAVAAAENDDITVIAAVGSLGSPEDGDPRPYPASYDGVLGVGALQPDSQYWTSAEHGWYVDLVAPGVDLPALARVRGLVQISGGSTAIAAGYVSGAAALVRARFDIDGRQVGTRLMDVGTPAAGGFVILNPHLAVIDDLQFSSPAAIPGFTLTKPGQAELARAAARRRSRQLAVQLTVVGLGVLLIVVLAAIGVPRARRRAWRPTLAVPPRQLVEPDEPGPPAMLFEDPSEITR